MAEEFIDGCFLAGSSSFFRVLEVAEEVAARLFEVEDPDITHTNLDS